MKWLLIKIIFLGTHVTCEENNTLNGFLSVVQDIVQNVSSQILNNEIQKHNQSEELKGLSKHSGNNFENIKDIEINTNMQHDDSLLKSLIEKLKEGINGRDDFEDKCSKRCGCGRPGRCGYPPTDSNTRNNEDIDDEMCNVRCGCGRPARCNPNNSKDRNAEVIDDEFCNLRCGCGRPGRCGCGRPGRSGNQPTDTIKSQDIDENELCSVRCGCGPGRCNPTTNHDQNTELDAKFCSTRCGCGGPGRCSSQNNFDELIDDVDSQLQRDKGYKKDVMSLNYLQNLNDETLNGNVVSVRCGCRRPERCGCTLEPEVNSKLYNIYELPKDRRVRNEELYNRDYDKTLTYQTPSIDKLNIYVLHDYELIQFLRSFVSANHKITKLNVEVRPNLLKALASEIYNLDKTKSNEKLQLKKSRITYAPQEIAKLYNRFKDEVTTRIFNYIKNVSPKKDLPYLTIKPRREFKILKNQYKKRKLNDTELKHEIIDMLLGKKGNIRIMPHKRCNNDEMIIPNWLYTAFYKMRRNHKKNIM